MNVYLVHASHVCLDWISFLSLESKYVSFPNILTSNFSIVHQVKGESNLNISLFYDMTYQLEDCEKVLSPLYFFFCYMCIHFAISYDYL